MHTSLEIKKKLDKAFDRRQATALAEVIENAYSELVKTSDFNELKGIVKELAEAQKGTEIKMEELAEAQKGTEVEIQKLTKGLNETRGELGGLSRSMGYAFENEAYRMLPEILDKKYGITLKEKIIRADIGGKEINLFGKAEKEGRKVLIVGEAKLRLDDRRKKIGKQDVFEELEDKVKAVTKQYGKVKLARILITHYATKGFLKRAKEKKVIVVQSFEW